tara:strand:+ start:344 stop:1036 length:693 start_codon:yes stop_codon:yes gene_type:complete
VLYLFLTIISILATSPQIDRLEDARFQVDVLDDAFYALLETQVKQSNIIEDVTFESYKLTSTELDNILKDPNVFLGKLFNIEGIVEQVRHRKEATCDVAESFIRLKNGTPIMYFYSDDVLLESGRFIEGKGYFWKTIRIVARDEVERTYLAFVGVVPKVRSIPNFGIKVWALPFLGFAFIFILIVQNIKWRSRPELISYKKNIDVTDRPIADNIEVALDILRAESEENKS